MLGWDAFRRYDLFSLRPKEITRQFSSYDRTDKNNDGFKGTYSCLSVQDDGRCVIADAKGPGEISSIWFTYEVDSVEPVGDVKIELDSQTVVHHNVQSLVDGDLGAPFVWPFVGNTNDTNGGNVIKVPMPYSNSMKVTTSNNPHFYHLVYREFPSGTEVSTYNPQDTASDVLDSVRSFGVKDPKCPDGASGCPYSQKTHQKSEYTIRSGQSSKVAKVTGSGIATQFQLRVQEILGAPHVEDDGRAYGKGGGSTMKLQLDTNNQHCKLTRRLDPSIAHQRASVKVDGQPAGEWHDSGPSMDASWRNQVLELKPEITNGKSSITVQNTFESSDLDFNEFYYALHCKLSSSDDFELMDLLNVGQNNIHDEAAHGYQITGQTWSGVRHYHYGGDRGRKAEQSLDLISNLHLKISFDEQETVDAPIGSFFGSGLGKFDVRSLMLSIDTFIENGAFSSWWPMPFEKSMTVELVNQGKIPVHGSVGLVWGHWADGQPTPWGYFSTQYHRAETVTGQLWNFLSAKGQGVVYGVTHAFRGSIQPPANTLEFLEGDLKVWTNQGSAAGSFENATMLGTGTEDYYESGWYFTDAQYGSNGVPFAMPLTGMTAHESHELDCAGQCLSAYRQMLPDSMTFDNGISYNIEHGPIHNNINANYETTAFYYQDRP